MFSSNIKTLILIFSFIFFGYIGFNLFELYNTSKQPLSTQLNKTDLSTNNDTKIYQLDLFSTPKEETPEKAFNAPETKLTLRLHGIFYKDDQKSSAIISSAYSQEKSYQTKDTLPENAILDKIYPDRVVIKRNNKTETLRFPKYELLVSTNTPTLASPTSQETYYHQAIASPPTHRRMSNEIQRYHNNYPQKQNIPRRHRNSAIHENISHLLNEDEVIKAISIEMNDSGFTVPSSSYGPLLGLETGDVILEVNGKKVSQLQGNQKVVNELMNNKSNLSLKVKRNNEIININPSIPENLMHQFIQ